MQSYVGMTITLGLIATIFWVPRSLNALTTFFYSVSMSKKSLNPSRENSPWGKFHCAAGLQFNKTAFVTKNNIIYLYLETQLYPNW